MPTNLYTGSALVGKAPVQPLPVTDTRQALAVVGASNAVLTSGIATIVNTDPVAKVSLGLGTAAVVGSGPQLPPGASYTVDTAVVGTVYSIANTFQVTMYDCGGSSFLSPNPFPPFTTPTLMVCGIPTDDGASGWSAADIATFAGASRMWFYATVLATTDANILDIEPTSVGTGAIWLSGGQAAATSWVSAQIAARGYAICYANDPAVVTATVASCVVSSITTTVTTINNFNGVGQACVVGSHVTGTNIPANTTVSAIGSNSSMTISNTPTGSGTETLTFVGNPNMTDVMTVMSNAGLSPFFWLGSPGNATYSNPTNWPAGFKAANGVVAVQYAQSQGAHSNYDISTVIAADLLLLMH